MRSAAMLCAAVLWMAAVDPAGAILIRHDRPDARYQELAAKYPAVGALGRAGAGTLIASDWVITAAHVAAGMRQSVGFTVGGREYAIERRVLHPAWKEMAPQDVALLKLATKVEGIEPLALYRDGDEAGKTITFVGFGGTGTGETGPQRPEDGLKRAATNVVDRADEQWLHFTFDAPPSGTELEGISGPGDSGGPAILERDGRHYVVGISIWGTPGAKGRGTYGAREGYVRVSRYVEWFRQVIGGRSLP